MTRSIGYYVHHHGEGHLQRALRIAAHAPGRFVLLGTGLAGRTGNVPAIDLPDDRMTDTFDGFDATAERPEALHYAPVDHDGIRRRVARVAQWIAEAAPALMIVDVSVEIAMLARLASVPTVPVRLSGLRDDPPHRQAFAAAAAILAPFPAAWDDPRVEPAIRAKTLYAPHLEERAADVAVVADRILVVLGRGGGTSDGEIWAAGARAVPAYRWRVIGPCTMPSSVPANLDIAGWITDTGREIAAAAIVVGAAGDGVVGTVMANRRPFLCLPEDRPFDEQRSKARALAAAGVAVVQDGRPADDGWPALIAATRRLDPQACARVTPDEGHDTIASHLIALADGISATRRSA